MSVQIRNYFLERDLRYVFSYTAEMQMKREDIGLVPGGVRVNLFIGGGEVFQVLNERSPWAENNLRGKVLDGGMDWAYLGDDDVGRLDVQIAFKTTDGAYIESRYGGVFPLGSGGYREFLRDFDERGEPTAKLGSVEKPYLANVQIAPSYETSHPRYKWLTKLQCVGFGRVEIIRGNAHRASYDIYSLGA